MRPDPAQGMAIFITGASSGLGAALAEEYAASGVVLGLAARRVGKLEATAERCRARGATVHVYALDVTDGPATQRVADQFVTAAGRIDLVIANAGVSGWRHPIHDQAESLTALMRTNVEGVINTVMAFVPTMVKQGAGHLVATSSIAAFAPLPRGAYAASKIAVRYLMDSWRIDLAPYGILVTTIFPGFVATDLASRPDRTYPFRVSSPAAARAIRAAIARKARNFIFPWPWRFLVPLAPFVPGWLWRRLLPTDEPDG